METRLTVTEVLAKFNARSNAAKYPTISKALDLMKIDNSRSRTICLVLAMGYVNDTTNPNFWYKPALPKWGTEPEQLQ